MSPVRRMASVTAAAAALVLVACGGSSSNPGSSGSGGAGQAGASLGTAATTVKATDNLKFDPDTVTVKVGDIVEWDNTGSATHNITFDSQPSFTQSTFNAGDKWQVKFTQAGTYSYSCTIHPGMTGKVTVSS